MTTAGSEIAGLAPKPGFRKVPEIALVSFCPCVPLRYIASVRWQRSHRDTLQPIHQHLNSRLLCGASCFQNQLPKLQLCCNLFSMPYGRNLYQPGPAMTAATSTVHTRCCLYALSLLHCIGYHAHHRILTLLSSVVKF